MEIIYNEYSGNGHEVLNLWIIKKVAFFSETEERDQATQKYLLQYWHANDMQRIKNVQNTTDKHWEGRQQTQHKGMDISQTLMTNMNRHKSKLKAPYQPSKLIEPIFSPDEMAIN